MTPVYYLMISALGMNGTNTLSELSRTLHNCGCTLLNTKINALGNDLAAFFFVSGNWGAIAKMEAALPNLRKRLGLNIQARRSEESKKQVPEMPYSLQVVAIDRGGILTEITNFLEKSDVSIDEISVHTYATHTKTRMISLNLKISVPETQHLATLRDKIMGYCDDNNFDGFIEPLRNV